MRPGPECIFRRVEHLGMIFLKKQAKDEYNEASNSDSMPDTSSMDV